jgi:hypothetical protein
VSKDEFETDYQRRRIPIGAATKSKTTSGMKRHRSQHRRLYHAIGHHKDTVNSTITITTMDGITIIPTTINASKHNNNNNNNNNQPRMNLK